MSNFVTQWQHKKTQFGKEVLTLIKDGGDDVPSEIRDLIFKLIKLETGMTPALKLADDAIGKEDTTSAMKALVKVHKVIEKTDRVFQVAARDAMTAWSEATTGGGVLEKIAKCVSTFYKDYKSFETDVSEAIEYLQEKKGGVKIKVFSLEGDLKGAVSKFKKDIEGFKSLEKRYNVMTRVDDAVASMKLYSAAVAKSKVADAHKELMSYFKDVDDLEKYFKNLEGEKPPLDQDYLEAVEKLCKALRTIKNQRGQDSLRDLNKLIADGHG